MRNWLMQQEWKEVSEAESAHDKAQNLQTMLLQNFYKFFPEKTQKISSDDQPWISNKLKQMDRKRKQEFHKH